MIKLMDIVYATFDGKRLHGILVYSVVFTILAWGHNLYTFSWQLLCAYFDGQFLEWYELVFEV